MISPEDQEKNFQHLRKQFDHQRKVRNCEVEGTVSPSYRQDAVTMYCHGLINMIHSVRLENILEGKPEFEGISIPI